MPAPIQNNKQENTKLDIRKYLLKLAVNWYWIVLSLGLALGVAFFINFTTVPLYRAGCSISINFDEGPAADLKSELSGNFMFESDYTQQKIVGTLKSYVLADKTLNALDFGITYYKLKKKGFVTSNIYGEEPFTVILDQEHYNRPEEPIYVDIKTISDYTIRIADWQSKTIRFGEWFENDDYRFKIVLNEKALNNMRKYMIERYFFIIHNHNSQVKEYIRKLTVQASPYSGSILTLSLTGENSRQLSDYLNKFCEVFMQQRIEDKNEKASKTLNYISRQIEIIESRLEVAEDSLMQYRHQQLINNFRPEAEVIMAKIARYEEEKSHIRLQQKYMEYVKDYVKDNNADTSFILPSFMGLDIVGVNAMASQIEELITKRKKLASLTSNNNGTNIIYDKELELLKEQIISKIDANQKSLDYSITIIDEQIVETRNDLTIAPVAQREQVKLQKYFEFNDNIYNMLIEKQFEANLAMASTISDSKILEQANPANASIISPQKTETTNIAVLLGLVIPILIILSLEALSNKLSDVTQITSLVNIPIIGKLGHSRSNNNLPVKSHPQSVLAESFRTLRSKLLYILPEQKKKVIAFTSASSGEGKTFCSTNFASVLAGMNEPVIILGLDLRKPKLHEIFKVDNKKGLSTFLIGHHTEEEVIQQTEVNHLDVILSGPVPPNPVELLESGRMHNLIESLKNKYKFIILDTPPVGLVADNMIINKFTDINLFVLRMNLTTKNVLNYIDELSREKALKSLNIIINDIKLSDSYGRNYYSSYTYSYGHSRKRFFGIPVKRKNKSLET